jgi:peptidyl-prolyl cis-trans isomerase C
MRKILIILTIAVLIIAPDLAGRLHAAEKSARKTPAVSKESAGNVKDEEAAKAIEAEKIGEAKKAEEAKMVIVARVNGVDINMFMLTRAMNRVAPKYIKEGEAATPETTEKIKKEALDRLIFEELAVQEAIKEGINPTPDAIDKVVAQVRKNLGSEQAYKEYLDKFDLTEEALKKLIERSQRYEQITANEIYRKVKVDEKLVRDEYEKEKDKYILSENFVVEDVLFLQGKDEAATRKKANEVLETIKKNNNDVWKLVLDGTFIVREINIKKERFPEIYKTMAGMKVGDLSGVIKDKDGLHIINVKKKEPSRPLTFEEAKNTIELKFLVPAQNERREAWEKELREKAKIEVMPDELKKS